MQNAIIKIVSVAAVVFLPPTLVASVYGMNFEVMPKLKWVLGCPFAIFLIISSAVLPYVLFMRKGWLEPTDKSAETRFMRCGDGVILQDYRCFPRNFFRLASAV